MSYILEALRRAETERERKRRIPGLHAQPVPASAEEPGARRSSKAWLWVTLGVGAGVLLPLLWRWWVIDPIAAEAAAAARAPLAGSVTSQATGDAAAPSAAAASASTAAPEAASAPETPAAAQAAAPAAKETPHPARPTHATAKAAATVPRTHAAARERVPTRATAPTATEASKPAGDAARPSDTMAAAPAVVPEPKLPGLNEMPADIRRSVPPLSFGGSVYSEIAAQRMVIFNGQVLREGDAVTSEVFLEQIRPHSAVLRVRGQRFEVTF